MDNQSRLQVDSLNKVAYGWTNYQSHLRVDTIVILLQISDSFTSDSTYMNLSTDESGFITFHIPTVLIQTTVRIGGQLIRTKITLV